MSAETLHDYYIGQIQDRGFASAEFRMPPMETVALFANLEIVLGEVFERPSVGGQQIINALKVCLPGREGNSKGFIDRRRVGDVSAYEVRAPGTEDKDIFHFTPQTYANATRYFYGKGGMPRVLHNLLEQCSEFHEAVKIGAKPIADAVGLGPYIFGAGRHEDVHINRFLVYPARTEAIQKFEPVALKTGSQMAGDRAELHFDRGIMSVAAVETGPGLVGVPANNAVGNPDITVEEFVLLAERALRTPIVYEPGRMKIFISAAYNHLPKAIRDESGNLAPLLHGVVNQIPGTVRYAGVTFLNQHSGILHWKTPSSEHETGFSKVLAAIVDRQKRYGAVTED